MSNARGKILAASANASLARWIKTNASWYYAELDALDRPSWRAIADLIATDGVTLDRGPNKGQPPTPDAVRKLTEYYRKDYAPK